MCSGKILVHVFTIANFSIRMCRAYATSDPVGTENYFALILKDHPCNLSKCRFHFATDNADVPSSKFRLSMRCSSEPLYLFYFFFANKKKSANNWSCYKSSCLQKLFNSQCCIWYSSLQCLVRNWSLGFIMSAGDDWKWNLSSRVRLDFFCNWILDVGLTLAYVSKTADECLKLGYVFLPSFQHRFV